MTEGVGGYRGRRPNSQDAQERRMKARDTAARSRQLTRQGHGRLIRGDAPPMHIQKRPSPDDLAASDMERLSTAQIEILVTTWRSHRDGLPTEIIGIDAAKALRKLGMLRRKEDPETGKRDPTTLILTPRAKQVIRRSMLGSASASAE